MTSRARRGGFYLNDHLGSARVVVNAQTGQVADFHWYYAYGAPLGEQTSTGQSYKYTGKPFDDEGGFDLYYYGARSGIWLRDPPETGWATRLTVIHVPGQYPRENPQQVVGDPGSRSKPTCRTT